MFDILILSNGPGEITTWVRPVVKALRNKLGQDRDKVRISIVLSPWSNASGDQFFPIVIGKRLNYRTVVYAEWEARWHSLINRFGVMKSEVIKDVKPKYIDKFTVVGDLMAEASSIEGEEGEEGEEGVELIGILPGSKAAKLSQGVP